MDGIEYVLTPRSEIEGRIKRFAEQMGGLTGAILFHSVDLGYFSGTCQDGLIYISSSGDSTVLIRKSLDRAMRESSLNVGPLKSLKSIKSDLQIPNGSTIGMELDVLPYSVYARIAKALGDVRIVDVSGIIKDIRSVKSEYEIDLMRRAACMVDAGIAAVADHIKEGCMEVELAAKVEAEMRAIGHEGVTRFRRYNQVLPMGHLMAGDGAAVPSFVASPTGGSGVSVFHPQGPGFRKIKRNEPILVDYGGVYNGYIADETRIFSIGKLPKWLVDAHEAAVLIEDAIERELSGGRTGREMFELSERVASELGFRSNLGGPDGAKCGFVGHGVGLEIDEHPVLGPVDHSILPNMTIAVEPKMIYPGFGVVGVEDTFLTSSGSCKRLTGLPREIWTV